MYNGFIFEGAAHRHQEVVELVEDLGGHVLDSKILSEEATITFVSPEEDTSMVEDLADDLDADLRELTLVGAEVAIVTPTLTRHHLPHPVCDIAEHLRRGGARTNVVGLARGVGQRIAQITRKEEMLIEEQDVAIFILGNFEHCLEEYKWKLYKEISIPVVVTGGPDLDQVPHASEYVGGIGRIPYRSKFLSRIEKMDEVAEAVEKCLNERKKWIDEDPPLIPPLVLKSEIENQFGPVKSCHSPLPIVPQLDGVRVKLRYGRFVSDIKRIKIGDYRIEDIAEVKKSIMKDHILVKLFPESEVLS